MSIVRTFREKSTQNNRIELLDAVRGISIILMVFYHWFYDLAAVKVAPDWIIYNPVFNVLQPLFAGLFIFIAGVSSQFSRNNLKRGLLLVACAAIVSLVTYLNGTLVWFGIIHFMAVAVLLYWLLEKLKITFPFVFISAFVFGYFGLTHFPTEAMAEAFPTYDYFPIIPWGYVFFLGVYCGRPIKEGKWPKWFYETKVPFFPKVGRQTLLIYMVHQPIVYGLTIVLQMILA